MAPRGMVIGRLSPEGSGHPQDVVGETGLPFPGCSEEQGARPILVSATHPPSWLPSPQPQRKAYHSYFLLSSPFGALGALPGMHTPG